MTELNRQLTLVRNQQDRLLNLRLMDEIEEDTFASKNTELRDRVAQLKLEIDGCDRGSQDRAEAAERLFELSQTLRM